MLGNLARWLRVLGFDTAYERRISDEELIRACLAEQRIALTRDRRLVKRRKIRSRSLLLEQDSLSEQIREVLQRMDLRIGPGDLFSRCLECNSGLEEIPKARIRDRVPPYVYRTQEHFCICPSCKKIYWAGTHRPRMLMKVQPLLEEFSCSEPSNR